MNRETRRASSRKRTKSAKTPVETPPSLPKDLSDQWGAVRGASIVFHLLQDGAWTYKYQNQLQIALKFMEELYSETMKRVMEHPEASLIPELKEMLEAKAKEAKDGAPEKA